MRRCRERGPQLLCANHRELEWGSRLRCDATSKTQERLDDPLGTILSMAPSVKSIAASLKASAAEKDQDRQHDDDNDDEHDEGEDVPPFNKTGRGRSSTDLIDRRTKPTTAPWHGHTTTRRAAYI
jgi:hypothetical protein